MGIIPDDVKQRVDGLSGDVKTVQGGFDLLGTVFNILLWGIPLLLGGGFLINQFRDQLPDFITNGYDGFLAMVGNFMPFMKDIPIIGDAIKDSTTRAIANTKPEDAAKLLHDVGKLPMPVATALAPHLTALNAAGVTPENISSPEKIMYLLTHPDGQKVSRSLLPFMRPAPAGTTPDATMVAFTTKFTEGMKDTLAIPGNFEKIWSNVEGKRMLLEGASAISGITFKGDAVTVIDSYFKDSKLSAPAQAAFIQGLADPATQQSTLVSLLKGDGQFVGRDVKALERLITNLEVADPTSGIGPMFVQAQQAAAKGNLEPLINAFTGAQNAGIDLTKPQTTEQKAENFTMLLVADPAKTTNESVRDAFKLAGSVSRELDPIFTPTNDAALTALRNSARTMEEKAPGSFETFTKALQELAADTPKPEALGTMVTFYAQYRDAIDNLITALPAGTVPVEFATVLNNTNNIPDYALKSFGQMLVEASKDGTDGAGVAVKGLTYDQQLNVIGAFASAQKGDFAGLSAVLVSDTVRRGMTTEATLNAIRDAVIVTEEAAAQMTAQQLYDAYSLQGFLTGDGRERRSLAFGQAAMHDDGTLARGVGTHNIALILDFAEKLDAITGSTHISPRTNEVTPQDESDADGRNAKVIEFLLKVVSGQPVEASDELADDISRRMGNAHFVQLLDQFLGKIDTDNLNEEQRRLIATIHGNLWTDTNKNGKYDPMQGTSVTNDDKGLAPYLGNERLARVFLKSLAGDGLGAWLDAAGTYDSLLVDFPKGITIMLGNANARRAAAKISDFDPVSVTDVTAPATAPAIGPVASNGEDKAQWTMGAI